MEEGCKLKSRRSENFQEKKIEKRKLIIQFGFR